METITFRCKIITPMFLAGADGRTPELRGPSIKGALRFWWRAVHGHLSLDRLRKQEMEIFGGVGKKGEGKRSRVIIRILKNPTQTQTLPLVAHDNTKGWGEAFVAGQEFVFKISYHSLPHFSIQQLDALIRLTFILGGLGRRQRRGMGASEVIKVDDQPNSSEIRLEYILGLLNTVNPKFQIQSTSNRDYIKGTFSSKPYSEDYPFIKNIDLGSQKRTLYDVSFATHEVKEIYKPEWRYGNAMGKARGGRLASPMVASFISVNGGLIPVITTLSTVYKDNQGRIMQGKREQHSIQEDFRTRII